MSNVDTATKMLERIEDLELRLDSARRELLRARGWKYTSSTPGAYWVHEKEIDGRILLVPTLLAVNMEEALIEREAAYAQEQPRSS